MLCTRAESVPQHEKYHATAANDWDHVCSSSQAVLCAQTSQAGKPFTTLLGNGNNLTFMAVTQLTATTKPKLANNQ